MDALKALVDGYESEVVVRTRELIRIESVESEAKARMPFGEGIGRALEYVLDLAGTLGFETANADGYAGHADLGGGEPIVGVLVHLDVVPEGNGWTHPAFGGEVHGEHIYGRGAVDNKGPCIAVLYAMKALRELAVPLSSKVRLIFGTHEESTSGWSDLRYYFGKFPRPALGFSPDARFPVIYGEKGLLNFRLAQPLTGDGEPVQLIALRGGNAPNMVPDFCEAELAAQGSAAENLEKTVEEYASGVDCPLSLKRRDGRVLLRAEGVSAHGSRPELGKNAISHLFAVLSRCPGLNASVSAFARLYQQRIGFQLNGQSIGCGFADDISGKLTFNVGMAEGDAKRIALTVNVRYPIASEGDKVIGGIREALADTGIGFELIGDAKPLLVSKDDALVRALMEAYRQETGDREGQPITIGGGTYARALPKAVAFGPVFPGQEDLAHQKDERIAVGDLMAATRIYASALQALTR